MRFRVIHLLMAMGLVGLYTTGLTYPNWYWSFVISATTGVVLCYILQLMKAHSGRYHLFGTGVLISALVFAFLGPLSLELLPARLNDRPFASILLSFLLLPFALLGGTLGAYWSKPQSQATKE